jgi:hypothetical protein
MTKALLTLHVIAAILAVGPVAVAASMFPAVAGRARSDPEQRSQLIVLHRICNVYAVLGVAVPIFGVATAASLHVLGSPWLIASMALTGVAAFLLAAVILPAQQRALADLALADDQAADLRANAAAISRSRSPSRLAASTGIFNLLWATVTVLMILRPGSTTGV